MVRIHYLLSLSFNFFFISVFLSVYVTLNVIISRQFPLLKKERRKLTNNNTISYRWLYYILQHILIKHTFGFQFRFCQTFLFSYFNHFTNTNQIVKVVDIHCTSLCCCCSLSSWHGNVTSFYEKAPEKLHSLYLRFYLQMSVPVLQHL